jgi:hypothetical protein
MEKNDLVFSLMAGVDIPCESIPLVIHPPTLRDIAYMGEKKFFLAAQYLCLDKEALIPDKTISDTLTNFQVLMKVLSQSQDKEKKLAVNTLLLLLFPEYKVAIMPKSIILTKENMPPTMIDDNNFEELQNLLKAILCIDNIFSTDSVKYNPQDERAQAIADKLMAGRRKVAEIKSKENEGSSILARFISILAVGLRIPLEDCLNYTLF